MSGAKGKAPKVSAGMASKTVIDRNVTGSGPRSLAHTNIGGASVNNAMEGSTGSNLLGRVKTGFGYILQFERGGQQHIVVATRGTRPELGAPDIMTDLNISTGRHFPGIGPVHSGFYDTYKSLKTSLDEAKDLFLSADVVHCVGHSLGGAVANLVAIFAAKIGAKVKLYTFGAPRVGLKSASYDKRMNALIGAGNIFRVSHALDPIPMIPIAPYIHVDPHITDKNNFFLGSPVSKLSMDNHDTNNYISSVGERSWGGVRAGVLTELDVDRRYFRNWMNDENWLKKSVGVIGNAGLNMLARVLRGMLASAGKVVTEIVTIVDLVALTLKAGLEYVSSIFSSAKRFLGECLKLVGVKLTLSRDALRVLLRKLGTELKIAAKAALRNANKVLNSKEFNSFLVTASAGSIGLMLV